MIHALGIVLCNEEESIIKELERKQKDFEPSDGAIITLVFHINSNKYYVGDLDLFQKVLISKAKEKYFKQYGKKSLGQDQMCFTCQQKRPEVYGFVNTYNFYTVDKPGFVTGGFNQEDAWRNYPVCLKCARNLELGKKYLGSKMIFSFYGYRYILIPKFFSDKVIDDTLDALEDTFDHRDNAMIQASFEKTYINRITDAEDEILEYISDSKDYVSFDLLFYQEKQAAFNILLHVEDVLPSRFKKLFEVKAKLDEIDMFKNQVYPDTGKRALFFNFGLLRRFFPFVSKTQSYDKYFLELTGKIFSLRPIEYNFFLKAIVNKIRTKFVNNEYIKTDCLAGYMLLNYLAELEILNRGGQKMEIRPIRELQESFGSSDTSLSEKIDLFFNAHSGFFDNTEKKVCFLVGLLVQKLLNIQWKDKNATPFRSKLQGLRLTEPLIRKIFYQAQDKLEQYKKNYYRELENVISQYMISSGSKWLMTNDEIAFYFTVGMNLNNLFKTTKEEAENDGP
jgi:CRISPR-associated protein Csh1